MEAVVRRAGTARVVVVDDTEDIRDLVRLSLEARGPFQVVGEAGDGLAGIAAVETLQPDLVLLDLQMPVMTGLDALPRIKEVCPRACVVVMSGLASEVMAQHAMEAGADGYAQKGMSPADLVALVGGVLSGPSVPRQADRRA